jgi:hypothetical protein
MARFIGIFILAALIFSAPPFKAAYAQCGFNIHGDYICQGGAAPAAYARPVIPTPATPQNTFVGNPSGGAEAGNLREAVQAELAHRQECTAAAMGDGVYTADECQGLKACIEGGGYDAGFTCSEALTRGMAAPALQCSTDWQSVASDELGWYSNGVGNGKSADRFSIGTAPDGSAAVQHTIKKSDEVWPLGFDSPVFRPAPGYRAVSLSYLMYIEEGKARGHPGKYMSLMGGRGQAGGAYQNKAGTGPEGWSHYMNSPVVEGTKGTTSAKNGLRAAVGSANRSDTGAECVIPSGGVRPGGDPVGGDKQRCFEALYGTTPAIETGRWVAIEIVNVMNDKGMANGEAYFIVDGQKSPSMQNVMWAMDPESSPELWVRWRMMFGGNPDQLPPPQDIKEWYRGFFLSVCY